MKRFAIVLACATWCAVPTTAQAATVALSPAKTCYVSGDKTTVQGAGFTPGSSVEVKIGDETVGHLIADAAGNLTGTLTLGSVRGHRGHTRPLIATDTANPALTATMNFTTVDFGVTARPRRAKVGRPLRIRASGFPARRRLYAHVRGPGYRSTRKVGRLRGACGTLSKRKRLIPRGARTGAYRVQFDTRRRFSPRTRPRYRTRMWVYRRGVGASTGPMEPALPRSLTGARRRA